MINDTFHRFVISAQLSEAVAQWEEEGEHSTWSALKLVLSTAIMMLGAWLLYALQDIFQMGDGHIQMGDGHIAALGTASGGVINLARMLKGKSPAASG